MCLLHDIWCVMPVIPPPAPVALGPDSGSWPPRKGFTVTLTGQITLGTTPLDE